jgi:hypothetical protein
MSLLMEDEIKRWTARRKTTIAEASRAYDLPPVGPRKLGGGRQEGHGERPAG